jgi:deazaflavin-dependent oxidoreductase (nitroreductase family)
MVAHATISGVNVEADYGHLDYCYLTTTGRRTGAPREIEIWFGAQGNTLYLLSGGGEHSHWVRNLRAEEVVRVRLGSRTFDGRARVVQARSAEDRLARQLLVDKYSSRHDGSLDGWGRTALPVAIELDVPDDCRELVTSETKGA